MFKVSYGVFSFYIGGFWGTIKMNEIRKSEGEATLGELNNSSPGRVVSKARTKIIVL